MATHRPYQSRQDAKRIPQQEAGNVSASSYMGTQNVQGKLATYTPFIRETDEPAVEMNKETMDRYRPELAKHYYDPRRYATYLQQLGVAYPPPLPPAPAR